MVKVVTNEQNEALYFSRAPIPFQRGEKTDYFKHIGVYGYPREILMRFVMLPQTPLEQAEMLEQLRLIENNILIKMIATDDPFHGVDTKEDIQKIEEILGENSMSKTVRLNDEIVFGGERPFVLIAGPCMLESKEVVMETAARLKEITSHLGIPFIFKGSFDKANRSSIFSERGPGLQAGLNMLANVKDAFRIPVLSDIHEPSQAALASQVLDIIQIPAFLCRQTDLLTAAAKTGKVINVKKVNSSLLLT